MKMLLDAIGSLFVYRSPEGLDCMRSNLRYLSNKKLQGLAGTKSHYSKTILINMIVDEMNGNT